MREAASAFELYNDVSLGFCCERGLEARACFDGAALSLMGDTDRCPAPPGGQVPGVVFVSAQSTIDYSLSLTLGYSTGNKNSLIQRLKDFEARKAQDIPAAPAGVRPASTTAAAVDPNVFNIKLPDISQPEPEPPVQIVRLSYAEPVDSY